MRKIAIALGAVFSSVLIFSACSKNPVASSMSSMSISAASTSAATASASLTTNSGGSTSVNTMPSGTVSSGSGDTGVTGVYAYTGVSSSIPNPGAGSSGSTTPSSTSEMTWTVYAGYDYVDHTIRYVTGTPKIKWITTGVNGSYQKVSISISKNIPIIDMWEIKDIPRSRGSVVYGDASAGIAGVAAKTLTPGVYSIGITVYDTTGSGNSNTGGGNFIVQ